MPIPIPELQPSDDNFIHVDFQEQEGQILYLSSSEILNNLAFYNEYEDIYTAFLEDEMILEEKEFFEIGFKQYVSYGQIHENYHKEIAHSSLPINQNQDFVEHVSFLSLETNEKSQHLLKFLKVCC
jgi:hypothetical protein